MTSTCRSRAWTRRSASTVTGGGFATRASVTTSWMATSTRITPAPPAMPTPESSPPWTMVQRQQDNRGAHSESLSVAGDGGGHDQRRRQKPVLVLVVLPKEARVETGLLRQLRFGDNLVDTPVNVIAPGRIGDGTVYTKFHNHLCQSMVRITTSLYSAPKPVNEKELLAGMTNYGRPEIRRRR